MKKKAGELLAPAGSREAFYAAVKAGADAVYLAGKSFGARAYADNFSEEELSECIRYAHLYGVRVYLTVNTLVKEEELAQLPGFMAPLYAAGLDGVIVQDLGVLRVLRETFPGLELHASTQMSVTAAEGALFLKDQGVCRVVPARELSLEEVRTLKQESGLEVECFIHGALCYCYSGKCLFSSMLGGRSGNRGRCAQPCRLPYDGEYPLSLKDLSAYDITEELTDAEIDSFKIEGRMKSSEYVAAVTNAYRKKLDGVKNAERDARDLLGLYVRGETSEGYYHRRNGREMVSLDGPGYNGQEERVLESVRDSFLRPEHTTYAPAYPLSMELYLAPGSVAVLNLSCGDLYASVNGDTVQAAQKKPLSEEEIKKQLLKLGGSVFSCKAEEISVYAEGDVFLPVAALNALRRKGIAAMEEQILESKGLAELHRRTAPAIPENELPPVNCAFGTWETEGNADGRDRTGTCYEILLRTKEQALTFFDFAFDEPCRVLLEESLLGSSDEDAVLASLLDWRAGHPERSVFVMLNQVRRKDGVKLFERMAAMCAGKGFDGAYARCTEDLQLLEAVKASGLLPASFLTGTDHGLYVWNREAAGVLSEHADLMTLPLELSAREQERLLFDLFEDGAKPRGISRVVYGRAVLMVSAGCVTKTRKGCLNGSKPSFDSLTDRYGKTFPVLTDCVHCQNLIFNSLPTDLHKHLEKWEGKCNLRLEFSAEGPEETCEVLELYLKGAGNLSFPVTGGYESRPVE
ncbi:MAG: U32 family peptidase [Lachnospiraceae bacterium]|nr:U32 family peptidase [Lachnospiraceae bacterium]